MNAWGLRRIQLNENGTKKKINTVTIKKGRGRSEKVIEYQYSKNSLPWSKTFKNYPLMLVTDKQQIIKNLKNGTSKQNYKDERDYKGRKNNLAKLQKFQK